jgi:hypothetical protein
MTIWPELLKVPVNLLSIGMRYLKPDLDLNSIEPAKRDIAYLHDEAGRIGLTPTAADEERFVEYVVNLTNDGMSEVAARALSFNAIYELDKG